MMEQEKRKKQNGAEYGKKGRKRERKKREPGQEQSRECLSF
jgi:hypothetical protein